MVVSTLEQRWEILFTEDADFGKKKKTKKEIIFSGEAHFDLGGYVHKQNLPIWDTENPTHSKRASLFGAVFNPVA